MRCGVDRKASASPQVVLSTEFNALSGDGEFQKLRNINQAGSLEGKQF